MSYHLLLIVNKPNFNKFGRRLAVTAAEHECQVRCAAVRLLGRQPGQFRRCAEMYGYHGGVTWIQRQQ